MNFHSFTKQISTKKTIYAIFTVALIVLLSFGARKIATGIGSVLSSRSTRKVETVSTFNELSKTKPGIPENLIILKVGIDVNIVRVGKDSDGFMQTPAKWNEAGWFDQSSKTTQEGNIIINGHYDDNYGKPAAFWKLKNIVLNDRVDVVDEYGRPFTYEVKEIYYVAIDDPDRFKIFNSEKGKQMLTLITCGGVWIPGQSTYSKRLIIRADRVD